ncbi:hypothetical protein XENOCAPTIV_021282, partial [Xenoophorus captivus]
VLIQGLQNLNRAVHQDVVAVQLLPKNQWVAPSAVVLQDDGAAKDDNGHFVRSLGSAGEKDTEEEVLLLEHDVPHQAFSQAVLSFLPKMPWIITPEGPTLKVEQHTFHIFDQVKVTIRLDDSNIQHQKIRMALTEPVVRAA